MVIGDLVILGLLIGAAVAVVVAFSSSRAPRWTHSESVAEHTTVGDQTVVVVARKLSNPDRFDTETSVDAIRQLCTPRLPSH
jgi:Flp pilus assembly protein CpaB